MVDLAHSEIYRSIPIGDHVAREFPWWREATLVMPAGVAGRQRKFAVGPNATSILNDRESPIKINELRFIMDATEERVTAAESFTSVQIKHSKYDVLSRWLPIMALNTEDTRHFWGDTASAMIQLEYPYFIQRGQAFNMNIVPLTATIAARDIEVCLRGWDPYNNVARVMSKVVTMPAINVPVTVGFDENRDAAIYNMWLHDIGFGFTQVNAAAVPRSITDHLRIRINPGMGPKWTDQDVVGTRLSGLVHDDSCVTPGGVYRPTIIHRPVRPYILRPREVLTIQVRPEIATVSNHTWWCWAVGTQEGRYR